MVRSNPLTETPTRKDHFMRFKYTLAWLALAKTEMIMPLLTSENPTPGASNFWELAGRDLPDDATVSPDGIDASKHSVAEHSLVVLQLPTPVAMGESYFLGIVEPNGDDPARAFALEFSTNPMTQDSFGMLTELGLAGRTTFGPTDDLTTSSFVTGVSDVLSGKASPMSHSPVPVMPMFSP